MSSVVISGNTSGSITLSSPAVAGSNTITLPASTGTVALTSDIGGVGIGQTWQNLTSSRAFGTTYTNSTGEPIMVAIAATVLNTATWTVSVAGLQIIQMAGSGATAFADVTGTFIVPNGATYVATGAGGSTLSRWSELR